MIRCQSNIDAYRRFKIILAATLRDILEICESIIFSVASNPTSKSFSMTIAYAPGRLDGKVALVTG